MPHKTTYNPLAFKIENKTVREFAAILAAFPENLQNHTIACSGYTEFYLHNDSHKAVLTIDDAEFID